MDDVVDAIAANNRNLVVASHRLVAATALGHAAYSSTPTVEGVKPLYEGCAR
jgi:hypothetical protein